MWGPCSSLRKITTSCPTSSTCSTRCSSSPTSKYKPVRSSSTLPSVIERVAGPNECSGLTRPQLQPENFNPIGLDKKIVVSLFRHCKECGIFTLGTYDKNPTYTGDTSKVRFGRLGTRCQRLRSRHDQVYWCRGFAVLWFDDLETSTRPSKFEARFHWSANY